MAKPERDDKYKQEVWQKQLVAEKQAAALQRRAKLLRKFAEKYRNSSAEQIFGREKWYSKDEESE
jgi:hypothetical protein